MISVIIPIFNTGKYLNKCLSSVAKQTYQELEIILVNDCSSDSNTIEVIQKWVKKDSRFYLIDKKQNEGVDKARISGINASHGDYLAFVDSDDWLPLDAFESLLNKSQETGADMVKGTIANLWFGGLLKKVPASDSSFVERCILHDELMDKYYISFFGVNIISVSLCGTLFRRSLFSDAKIMPSVLCFGEDLTMNMKIFPFVQKFYQMEKVVYFYRQGLPVMSGKYLDHWLPNFNQLYKVKMHQIEYLHYNKAIVFQKIELINYIKSFVIGCNRHRNNRIPECIDELNQELQDPIYRNLSDFIKNEKWQNMAVMLENGDATLFWSYVTEEHKKSQNFRMKLVDNVCSLIEAARRCFE